MEERLKDLVQELAELEAERDHDEEGLDRCNVCGKTRPHRRKIPPDGWTCGDCRTAIKRATSESEKLQEPPGGFRKETHITAEEKREIGRWRQWYKRRICTEAEKDEGIERVYALARERYEQEQRQVAQEEFDAGVGKISRGVDGGDIDTFEVQSHLIGHESDPGQFQDGYQHRHWARPPREDANEVELFSEGLVGSHKLARLPGEGTVREEAERFQKKKRGA